MLWAFAVCVCCQIEEAVSLICKCFFFFFCSAFRFWLWCEHLKRVRCAIDEVVSLICRCFFYLQCVSFLVVVWAFEACALYNWGSCFLNLQVFFLFAARFVFGCGVSIWSVCVVQRFCAILLFNILVIWIEMAILTNLLLWRGAGQYWNAV